MTVNAPLFSVRLVAAWLAAAALACLISLSLIVRDQGSEPHPNEPGVTIYSRSALGYAVLYHTLRRLGIPVGESTTEAPSGIGAGAVVVAEPSRDKDALEHVRAVLRRAPAVVLVLPKRSGDARGDPRVRLRSDELVPLDDAQRVLALVDARASVDRYARVSSWIAAAPLVGNVPATRGPQLMRTTRLQPLLSSPEGMLVGEAREGGRSIVVVSDPDLLANHGITRGDNARIAFAVVDRARGARTGPVLFDEVPHGFVSSPLGIVRLLLTFPFVLVTAQIALAVALLLWSAAGRFGAPKPREAALPLGKRSLIEGGSRLLAVAGHLTFVLDRYVEAVLRETAARAKAPRGLTPAELIAWFERTGRPVPAVAASPAAAADASVALAAAAVMHRWRNEVLDEPG